MDINYREIADRAVKYAAENKITLDYSLKSAEDADEILDAYHRHLSEYAGDEGAETLWNIAVHFGVYIGETLLRNGLSERGFAWAERDELPVLRCGERDVECSPITKAHKRILNGADDDIKSFCDVAASIAGTAASGTNANRAIDVVLISGKRFANIPCEGIEKYVRLVSDGAEDILILDSSDGYIQFYGKGNGFVCEARFILPDGDFRNYPLVNPEDDSAERVALDTPFGRFTPTKHEVITYAMLMNAVRCYYESADEKAFLAKIPHYENTAVIKKVMGIV